MNFHMGSMSCLWAEENFTRQQQWAVGEAAKEQPIFKITMPELRSSYRVEGSRPLKQFSAIIPGQKRPTSANSSGQVQKVARIGWNSMQYTSRCAQILHTQNRTKYLLTRRKH